MDEGVSVIIPTYNNPEFLNDCILSIKSQEVNFEFEILLGLDYCEKTLNHISENKKIFTEVEIFYFTKRLGPYVIKNNLIKETKYRYVLFFDSDDIMNKNMLQNFFDNIKDSEIVSFKYDEIIENVVVKKGKKIADGVFGIKKEIFNKFGGFQSWICAADSEFNYRTNYKKIKRAIVQSDSFLRRRHKKSLTTNPETGFDSKLRSEYKKIFFDKITKKSWDNPQIIYSDYSKINLDEI